MIVSLKPYRDYDLGLLSHYVLTDKGNVYEAFNFTENEDLSLYKTYSDMTFDDVGCLTIHSEKIIATCNNKAELKRQGTRRYAKDIW